ncbi:MULTISPECIES: hypothetical protein [unclassified Leucobacter]|uniref:hypothetical protein n=1 Tax=unclassified Leucobacter TaxID=2621730 RepID=UPI00117AD35A|nr:MULTISPECIES: hypothetical protein [unclassified Leucobacter]
MTESVPVENNAVHQNFALIDAAHPLRMPLAGNDHHILPRLDRLEAKADFAADYIAYLEARITQLEARLADRG